MDENIYIFNGKTQIQTNGLDTDQLAMAIQSRNNSDTTSPSVASPSSRRLADTNVSTGAEKPNGSTNRSRFVVGGE